MADDKPDDTATVHLAAVDLDEPTAAPVDDMVIRSGRICRAGDYPKHNWTLTPEDIKIAAAAYDGGGYMEIEHFRSAGTPSLLDGQLGELRRVWASEDGSELYGDVALPVWLDQLAGKAGRKVSAVWDRSTKALKGLGLVLDPAVPDAALMSAYVTFAKRHDTYHGQTAMQELHNTAVRHGATCSAGNATMASKHEASAIQQAHDLAVSHGATCDSISVGGTGSGERLMTYSAEGAQTEEEPAALSAQQKKETPTVADNKQEQEGPTVAELKALLDQAKAQQDEQRRALVALQAERRVEKADLWVDKLITESVIMPAERALLVKLHVMAATDDDTSGLVTLADGGKESRLATLVAAISARVKHGLTEEQIAANPDVVVLLNRQKTASAEAAANPTQEEKDAVLAMTPLGKQALAARKRRAAGNE